MIFKIAYKYQFPLRFKFIKELEICPATKSDFTQSLTFWGYPGILRKYTYDKQYESLVILLLKYQLFNQNKQVWQQVARAEKAKFGKSRPKRPILSLVRGDSSNEQIIAKPGRKTYVCKHAFHVIFQQFQ